MVVSASELRRKIYKLLDQVLDSGIPLEIERRGRRLRVVAADALPKLDRLVPHPDYVAAQKRWSAWTGPASDARDLAGLNARRRPRPFWTHEGPPRFSAGRGRLART